MATTNNNSHKVSNSPSLLMIGAIVGLLGGTLIGFVESVKTMLTIFNAVLPASAATMDVITLIVGLLFLTALYAIGGAAGLTVLGGLLILWQRIRRSTIAPSRVVVLLSAALVFIYTLFLTLDRLGIQELRSAGKGSALTWGLILLGYATFAAGIAWSVFNTVVDGQQQGRVKWLCSIRWSTARNLAAGLLVLFLIVPLAFVGSRRLNQSRGSGANVARAATTAAAGRPNIIFITIDALRADHLGAYGYQKARTPNIDDFAATGILFEQANSQAPWTFPSFASMFTSLYPTDLNLSVDNEHISQLYARFVDPAHITLAEAIQAAGYRTQAIVTNPWLRPEFGFAQGFEGFMQVDDARIYHFSKLNEMSLVTTARQIPRVYQAIRSLYTAITGNPGEPLVWDVRADRVTEEAVDWLQNNQDSPFFLWVHYVDPHYPFDPPAGYRPTVNNVTVERLNYLSSYNEEDVYTGRARLRSEDKNAIIALYDGEIAYTDVYVGKLLDEIDAQGLGGNTVVILSADHGDEFWDHGGYEHGHSLYDELIRVPLIMRGPDLLAQPGRRIAADVQHIDLMPTLVDLAGGTKPVQARGHSLLPLLRGEAPTKDITYNFAEALFLTEEKKAVRGGGYKLIYAPFSDQYELYDLIQDPLEQHNLVGANPKRVEELDGQLKAWLAATGAQSGDQKLSGNQGGVDPSTLYELVDEEE